MRAKWQTVCGVVAVLLLALTVAPAQAGLIGYWTFEGANDAARSADKTGAGHDVTLVNNALYGADVPTGGGSYALDCTGNLAGNGAYALVGGNENDFDLGANITVTAWVKGWPGTWNPFIAKNGEPNGWQFRNHGGAQTLDWTTRGTGFPNNGDLQSVSTAVANGAWHFIAATFNGTSKRIYVDYTNPANPPDTVENGGPGSISNSPDPVVFSARSNGGIGNYSYVKLDNVAIFSTALSQGHIAYIANGGDPAALPVPVAALATTGGVITGQALTAFGDISAGPPARYLLEYRPAGQSIAGLQGRYCTAFPVRSYNRPGGDAWTVFDSLANLDAYMAGQTVITQQLTGSATINFSDSGGANPFGVLVPPVQVGDNNYTDHMIGRWTGSFNVITGGPATFWTTSDDGSFIYIDGALVVDNNYFQGPTTRNGSIANLTAGSHTIDIAFYENDGGAFMSAEWQLPGGARELISGAPFSTGPAWQTLSDVNNTQVGDLLNYAMFPPDGRFGLPNGLYDLRLTVWDAYGGMAAAEVDNFLLTPEPASLALLGLGLAALARRRRKH